MEDQGITQFVYTEQRGRKTRREESRGPGYSRVTYGLIGTNGVDLGAEHHRGEDEEEEPLKAQENEEDDCCWRREGAAL